MSKKAAERLREYCRKTIEDSGHFGLDWAYGGAQLAGAGGDAGGAAAGEPENWRDSGH